jgi:hypothetical protein
MLLPRVTTAGDRPLLVDLDGDGQHDQLRVDRGRERSVLHVWLSASDTTELIHARVALVQVIAADLDGDHRPELIARDSESRIRVWTRNGHRFHSYPPRKVVHHTLNQPHHRSIGDNDHEPLGETLTTTFAPLALILSASPRAPGPGRTSACALDPAPVLPSLTSVAPFAPRPPPTFVLS